MTTPYSRPPQHAHQSPGQPAGPYALLPHEAQLFHTITMLTYLEANRLDDAGVEARRLLALRQQLTQQAPHHNAAMALPTILAALVLTAIGQRPYADALMQTLDDAPQTPWSQSHDPSKGWILIVVESGLTSAVALDEVPWEPLIAHIDEAQKNLHRYPRDTRAPYDEPITAWDTFRQPFTEALSRCGPTITSPVITARPQPPAPDLSIALGARQLGSPLTHLNVSAVHEQTWWSSRPHAYYDALQSSYFAKAMWDSRSNLSLCDYTDIWNRAKTPDTRSWSLLPHTIQAHVILDTPGEQDLTITAPGWIPVTQRIDVQPGAISTVYIRLIHQPIPKPAPNTSLP